MTTSTVLENTTVSTQLDDKDIHACLQAAYEYASMLDEVESAELDMGSGEPLLVLEGSFGELLISESSKSVPEKPCTIAVTVLDEDGQPVGKTKHFRFDESRGELFGHILHSVSQA